MNFSISYAAFLEFFLWPET